MLYYSSRVILTDDTDIFITLYVILCFSDCFPTVCMAFLSVVVVVPVAVVGGGHFQTIIPIQCIWLLKE